MGQFFGDLWVPFVRVFEADVAERTTKVIKHVDSSVAPYIAEFPNPVKKLNMEGTVIPVSTSDKTADDYIEDISALAERPSIDNYCVGFCGHSGFLSVASVTPDKDANTPLSREYRARGNFLAMARYQPHLSMTPKVLVNDFSFTLGSDDVDCYVAVPINAIYTGGDGVTETFAGEDGTITLVKTTTSNDVAYDLNPSYLQDIGEVKVYDDRNEALEADWFRVYHPEHKYTGNIIITNSLYRVTISTSADTVEVEYWNGSGWTTIETFSSTAFMYPYFLKMDMDTVYVKLNGKFFVGLERGMPVMFDTKSETLSCAVSKTTQGTTTDNYLSLGTDMYICSNLDFDISGTDLGTGMKWVFYDFNTDAQLTAHMVMVNRNLKRFLGDR